MSDRISRVAPFVSLVSFVMLAAGAGSVAAVAACSSDDGDGSPGTSTNDGGTLPDGSRTSPTDGGASSSDSAASDSAAGDSAAGDSAAGDSAAGDSATSDACANGSCGTSEPCRASLNTPGGTCLDFTPTITGADPSGENADEPSIAISPDSGAIGKMMLFLNGSGGHPYEDIASATKNFYNAAAVQGYQVLAVSYRSDESVGDQCSCVDSCFFPTRETLIRGVYQSGASTDLLGDGGVGAIRVDESIAGRTALALRWLVTNDTAHDWSQFLTSADPGSAPETQIDWSKIVVAGHSQGGGHAAAIGKMFSVIRVVQLSSTCDTVTTPDNCSRDGGDPFETTNSTWLQRDNGPWATPASSYWGLDIQTVFTDAGTYVSGDPVCFIHASSWQAEGVPMIQQNDNEATCDAGKMTAHNQSVSCADNFATWETMLAP